MTEAHEIDLAVVVGEALRERQLTISAAESCTGGLLLHRLTNVAGSSAYVMGGVVAYDNAVKQNLLKVPEAMLNSVGAVSEAVAAAMATGIRTLLQTNFGIGITGIAGPGGGTAEKPVGLTYIGLNYEDQTQVKRFVWAGNRVENKIASVEAALEMLWEFLQALS